MSCYSGPEITNDGLIFLADFSNIRSYPGSTVYDISGNGYNGTLVNTPIVSNGVLATSIDGNGAGNGATFSTINLSSSNTFTIFGASRYVGGFHARVIASYANNWLMGHWNDSVGNYYAAGWVSPATPTGGTDQLWRIYHATGNISGASYNLYINGVLSASGSGGTVGPNGITIGYYGNGLEPSNAECGFVGAYNIVLSADQVTQNFNALRGRYGL
jgi:hypothetical protein